MWCQQALDPTAVETLDERRKDLTRSALDAEEDVQESLETINDELEKLRSLGLDV